MNKKIFFLFIVTIPLLTLGAGCTKQNVVIQADQTQPIPAEYACATAGQRPDNNVRCCAGLEVIAIDNGYEVCGKPGTGYKPKACMTEGETPFIDTPKCCIGLEPVLKGDKYICLP